MALCLAINSDVRAIVSLSDEKYARAVAGLIFAMASPWHLDLQGNEFKETDAIIRAILSSTSLMSLNNLTLHGDEAQNLSRCVQRDRYEFVFCCVHAYRS